MVDVPCFSPIRLDGKSHSNTMRSHEEPPVSGEMMFKSFFSGWWYTYPSEKYDSQLGWWNSQLNGKIKHVPNHQPDTCGRKLFTRRVEDPVVSDWSSPPMWSVELGYPFLTDHNQLGYIVNVWVPIIHGLTNNDCSHSPGILGILGIPGIWTRRNQSPKTNQISSFGWLQNIPRVKGYLPNYHSHEKSPSSIDINQIKSIYIYIYIPSVYLT